MADINARLINKELGSTMINAVDRATRRVRTVVEKWGDKSVAWVTYKAMSKREGCWTERPKGAIDWVGELTQGFLVFFAGVWDDILGAQTSKVIDDTIAKSIEILNAFHQGFAGRPSNARSSAMLDMLLRQVTNRRETLRGIGARLKQRIQAEQREISRIVWPLLRLRMRDAFNRCANESGTGMYDRMRNINLQHAHNNSPGMFTQAKDRVLNRLTAMMVRIETAFVNDMRNVVTGVCGVYNNADIAIDGWGDNMPPREHHQLRQNVLVAMSGAELELKRAAIAPLDNYANDLRDDDEAHRHVDGITYVDKEEYTPHPEAESASYMFFNPFGDDDDAEVYRLIGQQSQGEGSGSGSGDGDEMFCSRGPAAPSYKAPEYGGLIE